MTQGKIFSKEKVIRFFVINVIFIFPVLVLPSSVLLVYLVYAIELS